MPNRQRGLELVRMEFRRFLHAIVLLPAQIVRSGRKIIYRIGLQPLAKTSSLPGKSSSDGTCLKQGAHQPIADTLGGTPRRFQARAMPWQGTNRSSGWC